MSKEQALQNLGIATNNKLILCCDGGGIRGILTLQLLKKIEEIAGMPCYQLFDMVVGTSTGGIIAGLIAYGKTATEIESKYKTLVDKVFLKRSLISNRFVNPPQYDKINYRNELKKLIGDTTLLQACSKNNIDLLITSKDVTAGEETFFTCFKNEENLYSGTYKDVLLRSVLEATMSAPTYFTPLERFIDGGTTVHNNPSLAALMEAVHYGPQNKYQLNKTTLFSLGTGISVQFIDPDETVNPSGPDVSFWLNYIMEESNQDANELQVDTLRNILVPLGLDFRRFQISLDEMAIKKLNNKDISAIKNIDANWLWELTNNDLKKIALDDVIKFPLMTTIGESMVEYIMEKGDAFKKDLIITSPNNTHTDALITKFGDPERIKSQLSNPNWIDSFVS